MSLSKSRELLTEVIGEEQFIEFENGFPIKVKSPDNYSYWMTKQTWGIKLQRMGSQGELSEGLIKANGSALYDSAASFVTSGKLGKVNWKCGIINIALPNKMPSDLPNDVSFISFLFGAGDGVFKTLVRCLLGIKNAIFFLPRGYVLFSIDMYNSSPTLCFGWLFGCWLVLAFVAAMSGNIRMFGELNSFLLFSLLNGVIMTYFGWRNKWMEVKKEIED